MVGILPQSPTPPPPPLQKAPSKARLDLHPSEVGKRVPANSWTSFSLPKGGCNQQMHHECRKSVCYDSSDPGYGPMQCTQENALQLVWENTVCLLRSYSFALLRDSKAIDSFACKIKRICQFYSQEKKEQSTLSNFELLLTRRKFFQIP